MGLLNRKQSLLAACAAALLLSACGQGGKSLPQLQSAVAEGETIATAATEWNYTGLPWQGDRNIAVLPVCQDGLYGVVDTLGRQVLPCQYKHLRMVEREWVMVQLPSGEYGLYTTAGREVLKPIYSRVKRTQGGDYIVRYRAGGYDALLDAQGHTVLDTTLGYIAPISSAQHDRFITYRKEEGRRMCSIVDRNGHVLLQSPDIYIDDSLDEEYNFYLPTADDNFGYFGLVDADGHELLERAYAAVEPGRKKGDLSWVCNDDLRWAALRPDGTWLTDFVFDRIDPFPNDWTHVEQNGLWGVMDPQGHMVAPVKYKSILGPTNGMRIVETETGFGYIDSTGREVVPCRYKMVTDFYSDSLLYVQLENEKWQPLSGRTVGKPLPGQPMYGMQGKYAICWYENELCLSDTSGHMLLAPGTYHFINFTDHEGIFLVTKSGSTFVNEAGLQVLPEVYSYCELDHSLFMLRKDDKCCLFNPTTGQTTGWCFDLVISYGTFYAVRQGESWGWINGRMQWVVPCTMKDPYAGEFFGEIHAE